MLEKADEFAVVLVPSRLRAKLSYKTSERGDKMLAMLDGKSITGSSHTKQIVPDREDFGCELSRLDHFGC